MAELINLDKLPTKARSLIQPYLEQMLALHGDNIISIVIYGSATGVDFNPKTSDINMVIIFKKLDFEDFKKSLKLVSRGISKKIVAPLFLTRWHVDTSADVFPVEFLEIKENHVLVYGEDIFGPLEIKQENIRLQCEQQIKGKLIRIRQAYLEIGLKRKGIEALLKESLSSFIPIFRNLLRLKGISPPLEKEQIIKELSAEFDLEAELFLEIWRDKQEDEKIGSQEVEPFFQRYIEQIAKLAMAVDQM